VDQVFSRYAYPEWLRAHSLLVGRVALVLAAESAERVDPRTVGLAAYLHDIGRSPLLAGDAREHNELSALILHAEGLSACAELTRRHPVYAVLDLRTAPRTLEEKIVYYADRRGGMAVLPLDERITETAVHHPRWASEVERSRPLARRIEREVFDGLRLRPEELAERVDSLASAVTRNASSRPGA
jgi:putative nucleotidyltransferase with HDIG domain